jgi:enoyl-CoA hydratase/carnithine racemase
VSSERVKLSIENGVALVKLNRPDKRNALDMAMFKALDDVSRALRKDRTVRAVIVRGAGEDFCSGLDVKSMMNSRSAAVKLLAKWLPGRSNPAQRVSTNWRRIPAPVIMAIHGRCWGGGLQIALGGDFRLVSPDATLSVMEGKWGLIPDMGGNVALRELVTKDVAMKLTMTAEVISAQQALDIGLVTAIADDPLAEASALARQIAKRSPDAVAATKKLYHRNWYRSERHMLAKESLYQLRILLGKNRSRAVRKQLKPDEETRYLPRKRW